MFDFRPDLPRRGQRARAGAGRPAGSAGMSKGKTLAEKLALADALERYARDYVATTFDDEMMNSAANEIRQLASDCRRLEEESAQRKSDIYGFHYAMKDAGWHPGRTDDLLTDIIRAKGQELIQVRVENSRLREALERAHAWMDGQADAQSKGCHATFDMMMLREERDAIAAALAAEAPKEAGAAGGGNGRKSDGNGLKAGFHRGGGA